MKAIIVSCLFVLTSACAPELNDEDLYVPTRINYGIFGGTPVNITEVPFMALFRPLKDALWWCGASIVHEQFLVTAAHCTIIVSKMEVKITVGTDKVDEGQDYEIEKVYLHPKYDNNNVDYDVAVIKLKQKLTLNERVKPIKMADSTALPKPGDKMKTMGFGNTQTGDASRQLLEVEVGFVDFKTCKKKLEFGDISVTDRMICAGGREGEDSCQGDSGGPLVYKNQLIGAVSWGLGCGQEGLPGVYASVPSMRDFIDEVIKNNTSF